MNNEAIHLVERSYLPSELVGLSMWATMHSSRPGPVGLKSVTDITNDLD